MNNHAVPHNFSSIEINRDGESFTLCKYARCLSRDCICKSSEDVSRDIHTSRSTTVTMNLRKGFYHDCYRDILKVLHYLLQIDTCELGSSFYSGFSHDSWLRLCFQDSSPHLIIAPNAGIAAYASWLPTIVCIWYLLISVSFSFMLYLTIFWALTLSFAKLNLGSFSSRVLFVCQ